MRWPPRHTYNAKKGGVKTLPHPLKMVAKAFALAGATAVVVATYEHVSLFFASYEEVAQYQQNKLEECQSSSPDVNAFSDMSSKNVPLKECHSSSESVFHSVMSPYIIQHSDLLTQTYLSDFELISEMNDLSPLNSLVGVNVATGSRINLIDTEEEECSFSLFKTGPPRPWLKDATAFGLSLSGTASSKEFECLLYRADLHELLKQPRNSQPILPAHDSLVQVNQGMSDQKLHFTFSDATQVTQLDEDIDDTPPFVFPDNDDDDNNMPPPPLNPIIAVPDSDVSQSVPPDGNINDMPPFVFPDDVHLQPISPVIELPSDDESDTSIPEPSTLIGVGVFAAFFLRLRYKRKKE